ncbi:2,3,4,5-tetrahydropyridine-2,6-dicarboxylate N-acetyltransferase [Ammoniphilus sp. CFH 90114]|uniref:2,3,4,5-tetrahydropyridine-2,6-dicarboxylate N-acetyltransferase n=1 Tax=Ammoniphilus sp. CFH 90114 TaxID=2493665 RepID=UPI00100FDDA7|nr:2,3,4,5-tetrahydropyridine-2,6-dicarboxylate N-acetyltransferase [Ammoniphilus sp. CFH 90114]RXT06308.1 2,3,4,5-tetrahydropyridine-2,6-dicarboxylate N-acetyltransferase [Ammoniphilus sp. CFH 90114]
MDTKEILERIQNNNKRTLVKIYIQGKLDQVTFGPDVRVIRMGEGGMVFGDWEVLQPILANYSSVIEDYVVEGDRRNSTIDLLDIKNVDARVEPGAIIREGVTIEKDAVIMMGACINIGARIGEKALIDMNAVIGGRASIGKRCHVGAGVVIKGVISSPHASPVTIEDDVIIGPNAVIMEGIHIGTGAIIGAGCIVTKDVQAGEVIHSPIY